MEVWAGGAAVGALEAVGTDRLVETHAPGPDAFRRFMGRLVSDVDALRRSPPDVLLTDGDAPSMHAAAFLGIPVVAIGHGLLFAYAELPGGLDRRLLLRERVNALSSSYLSRRQVAAHFSEARAHLRTTRIAAIDPRPGLVRTDTIEGHVVAYLRDGGGEAWLEDLTLRGVEVHLFTARTNVPRGVVRRAPDRATFAQAMSTARGAVGTLGSNLVGECVHLGIPLLGLVADTDAEQRLNGRLLELLGRGRSGRIDERCAKARARALDDYLEETSEVSRLGRRPDGLAGLPRVADAVAQAVESVFVEHAAVVR